jgi:hypothetical protein
MKYYKEIELSTWEEYKELAEKSRLEWIFRGQSNSNWDLQTTLDRSGITTDFPEFEDELIRDFIRGAKFYLQAEQIPKSLLEWFSMIQHFGAPSRLLDFTKSPYIAAYFAFEQATNEDIAIWIVDKIALFQSSIYYFNDKIDYSSHTKYTFDDNTFDLVFEKSKEGEFDCVIPMEPKNTNQRYHLQQSIFLCQGNPYQSIINQFEFIKKNLIDRTIIKVVIPSSEKKKAIRDLIKMNISRASLFPGLDGFAKSLMMKYSNLSTFGETHELLKYAVKKGIA